jgi:hypothetical protein
MTDYGDHPSRDDWMPDPIGERASEHERFEFDDAPYVLGALAPAERAAFEAHLAECPLCQRQVAELSELPTVLAHADESAWSPEPLPETLLPRLMRQVELHRRRRRTRTMTAGLLAACLVLVLALISTGTWTAGGAKVQALSPVGALGAHVTATVTLTDGKAGTNLTVTCDYQPSGPYTPGSAPSSYRLVVFNRLGDREQPATWLPAQNVQFKAMSKWRESNISKIEIEDDQGNAVMRLTM